MGGCGMVWTLARMVLVACAVMIAPWAAHAQAVDGYKPPSAARQSAQPAETQALAGPRSAITGSAPKTIGLISIIGDTYNVQTIGLMVFGNEEKAFPIPGWKVNDRVAATIGGLLKKNFRIKRIPASEANFASVYARGGLFRDITAEFDEAVRKVAANYPADYYLAVSRMVSPYGSSNQYVSGLGVTRAGVSALGGGDIYHALTMLSVYDSKLQPVRVERGSIGQDTLFAVVKGPHLVISDDAQRLPEDPQAALNHPRAKETVLNLLDNSLRTSVPKLFATD
jgi:hypothetical protein